MYTTILVKLKLSTTWSDVTTFNHAYDGYILQARRGTITNKVYFKATKMGNSQANVYLDFDKLQTTKK